MYYNKKTPLLLLILFILPAVFSEVAENGLVIEESYISGSELIVNYSDYSNTLDNTELVLFYAIDNTGVSGSVYENEASRVMYELEKLKSNLNSRAQLAEAFQLERRFLDSYGLLITKSTDDGTITIDLGCKEDCQGILPISELKDGSKIYLFLARYDLGRNLFVREYKSSLADKENISDDRKKYTRDLLGNLYLTKENMFSEENLESTKYSFDVLLEKQEDEDIGIALAIDGIEGEMETPVEEIMPADTEQEETEDIFTLASIELTDLNQIGNVFFSPLSQKVNYKYLNIPHYFLKDNLNTKKRIYQFNQGRTYVINNSAEEIKKEKVIELELNLSPSTKNIFVAIDQPQAGQIPSMSSFSVVTSTTIEVNTIPRYVKLDATTLKDKKLLLSLKPQIDNISLQLIEVDANNNLTAVYSTNIISLDYFSFNKYVQFQLNKNVIEFYCPYCQIKDYGLNENGFSACGTSVAVNEESSSAEQLSKKENLCLLPTGSRISGFTKDAAAVFGFDRLYFEWSDSKIFSDMFDYGEYYVDQDQFRVAVSKKLDLLSNNNYITLGGIKYKKGENGFVSKVGTYLEYDLRDIASYSQNNSIDDCLNYSIAMLNQIPIEYQKLTIIDLVNNEPAVSQQEFESIMQGVFVSDYHKATDYHTHYQVTVEKYIKSQDKLKGGMATDDSYSKLLYGLYTKTQGYTNIYLSEGLDYFIYNVKPFDVIAEETKAILGNEYTKFFGNYWEIDLNQTEALDSPKTVVVRVLEATPAEKKATLIFEKPSTELYVNYYSNNQYFADNQLFMVPINALSYNYGYFGENISTVIKSAKLIDSYSALQDGYKLFFSQSDISVSPSEQIIITKDVGDELIIRYYDGKEYVVYPKSLTAVANSTREFPLKESIVIYPQASGSGYPLLIESNEPLAFNTENISVSRVSEKYVYNLLLDTKPINLSEEISGLSNGSNCFSVMDEGVKIWENIDNELNVAKSKSYNEFIQAINSASETQKQEKFEYVDSGTASITTADYINDNGVTNRYAQMLAIGNYIQGETEKKGLEVLDSYWQAYKLLLETEPNLKKDFTGLFACNETLICKVLQIKYTPIGSFFERFKKVCAANTPTDCVKFWQNPKVNFCSAFTRNFSNYFFGYKYDSADAWDLAKQPNNKSIWKAVSGTLPESSYDALIPGSILGVRHNNTSYLDKEYSHVVVYLGKLGSHHYIIHAFGDTLKIEKLDVFLKTTARGKNVYGRYEDGQIKEVLIPSNLYTRLKAKARENGLSLGAVDSSIYEGVVPDYIFDSFNDSIYQFASTAPKQVFNEQMYQELEQVYNSILSKQFDIYYKNNYANASSQEIHESITLRSTEPMIIILGKYKRLFLVNKENGETNIILEYPVTTGVNGFGCQMDSKKTPIGLFKITQKVGQNCVPLQIIGPNGCVYRDGVPVLASYNSGVAKVVTRQLVIDGLEKGNIGLGCENGNRNTIYRATFIHGTNYERSIGQQRSHGCIRLLNDDVINLFNNVSVGTYVYIYNSGTSYYELLDLEGKLNNLGQGVKYTLASAKKPAASGTAVQSKTMADANNYIDGLISNFRLLDSSTSVDLDYASFCNKQTLKLPCFIRAATNREYNEHVATQQSDEFNYIVFRVTKDFNYTLEETAQFWASMAQESGTSTNITGAKRQYGDSLAGKPAKGIAQIEKSVWSNYKKNRETFNQMVKDFNKVDLSGVIGKDPKIGKVTSLTGNKNTIDSTKEITALLDLVWANQSKYASVVFAAGLTRYIGEKTIENSNNKNVIEPFKYDHRRNYDHFNSINYAFAIFYKYKYTGAKEMYSGIKKYCCLKGGSDTIKTGVLKLGNYLAFKKEYYMVTNGLKPLSESTVMATLKNAYGGSFPK